MALKRNNPSIKNTFYVILKKIVFFFVPFIVIHSLCRFVMTVGSSKSNHVIQWWPVYDIEKQIVPIDIIFPLTTLEFEGKNYQVPGNWDAYLRRLYSDYRRIPPEEERHTHEAKLLVFDTTSIDNGGENE